MTRPSEATSSDMSWGSSPPNAWLTIVLSRSERGARRAASLSACAAVLPRTIGILGDVLRPASGTCVSAVP